MDETSIRTSRPSVPSIAQGTSDPQHYPRPGDHAQAGFPPQGGEERAVDHAPSVEGAARIDQPALPALGQRSQRQRRTAQPSHTGGLPGIRRCRTWDHGKPRNGTHRDHPWRRILAGGWEGCCGRVAERGSTTGPVLYAQIPKKLVSEGGLEPPRSQAADPHVTLPVRICTGHVVALRSPS